MRTAVWDLSGMRPFSKITALWEYSSRWVFLWHSLCDLKFNRFDTTPACAGTQIHDENIYRAMSISLSISVSVAKMALLRSLQRPSRVTVQNQEIVIDKEMFLGVDG